MSVVSRQDPADAATGARDVGGDALRLSDIHMTFRSRGRRRREVVAVDGVSLSVGRGEIVGLVGESGSGKSTLGRVMAGLQVPDSGTVTIDGTAYEGRRGITPGFHGAVQMVFQSPAASLNPKMTIRSILGYAARRAGVPRDGVEAAVAAALEEVGVTPPERFLGRFPHELSGGQQQRVALARALLHRPAYLVADEPTSALDVSVRVQIIKLIREIQAHHRMGILFITHDLSVVRALAQRALVMYRGDIVEEGHIDDVFARPQHEYTRRLLGSTPQLVPPQDAA